MPVPLFSVGFYSNEILSEIHENLTPEMVYAKIPSSVLNGVEYDVFSRDLIYNYIAHLLTGESFRLASSKQTPVEKYILVTKTGSVVRTHAPLLNTDGGLEPWQTPEPDSNMKYSKYRSLCLHKIYNFVKRCFPSSDDSPV
jgi:hypothetical protein